MPDTAPITTDDLTRAEEWARLYGPANCWTGTVGSVAATLLKLIQRERERMADNAK